MKKHLFAIITAGIFIFLTACGNKALNKKFELKTVGEDMKALYESKAIDSTEALGFSFFLIAAPMTGEKLEGQTYGELLNKYRKAQKERKKED